MTLEPHFLAVLRLADLAVGSSKAVQVGGKSIALIHTADGVFALENRCPHKGTDLAGGWVEDGKIFCPMHGWEFDLGTGNCLTNPEKPVCRYATRINDGMVEV